MSSLVKILFVVAVLLSSASVRAQGLPEVVWSGSSGPGVAIVSFSPDRSSIVSGDDSGRVRIWRSSDGVLLREMLGHQSYVTSVAFSPDGQLIASSSWDGTVKIWRVTDGTLAHDIFAGGFDGLHEVAFSPDGLRIATAGADENIRVFRVSDGSQIAAWYAHLSDVLTVAFAPDGVSLASGSVDRTVKVWNSSTGAPLATLAGSPDWTFDVKYSPGGSRVAAACWDGLIRLWSPHGSLTRTLVGHQGRSNSISFCAHRGFLASVATDRTIRLWDSSTGVNLAILMAGTTDAVSVSVSASGEVFAYGMRDGTIVCARTPAVVPSRIVRVSPLGSDGNDGSSWTLAKRTIGAALEGALKGDEIWVAQGRYREKVYVTKVVSLFGGFVGSEVTRGQRDWKLRKSIIDGEGVRACVEFNSSDAATTLDGFVIENGYSNAYVQASGINSLPGGMKGTIANNVVQNCRSVNTWGVGGILVSGDVIVRQNTFRNNEGYQGGAIASYQGSALIEDNLFQSNRGGAIYISIYQASTNQATVVRNRFIGNVSDHGGGAVALYNHAGVLSSNEFSDNRTLESLYGPASGGGAILCRSSQSRIVNNTFFRNRTLLPNNGGAILVTEGAIPIVANNIMSECSSTLDLSTATVSGGFNCLHANGGGNQGIGAGDIFHNPLMVNPSNGNLHLLQGSPCVNAGNNGFISPGSKDFDGQLRRQGATVDIGADEFMGTVGGAVQMTAHLNVPPKTTSDCEMPVEFTYWHNNPEAVSNYTFTLTYPTTLVTFDAVAPGMPQPTSQGPGFVRWENLDAIPGVSQGAEISNQRTIKVYFKVVTGVPNGKYLNFSLNTTVNGVSSSFMPIGQSTVTSIGPSTFDSHLFFTNRALISADSWFAVDDVMANIYGSIHTQIGANAGLPSDKRINVQVDPKMYGRIWGGQDMWFPDTGRYPLYATVALTDSTGTEIASRTITTDTNFDQIYGDSSPVSGAPIVPWCEFDAPDPGVYRVSVQLILLKRAGVDGGGGFGGGELSQANSFSYWIAVRTRQTRFPDKATLQILARDSHETALVCRYEVRDEDGHIVAGGPNDFTSSNEQQPTEVKVLAGTYDVSVWSPFDGLVKQGKVSVSPMDSQAKRYLAAFVAPGDTTAIWLQNDQREGWTRDVGLGVGQGGHLILDNLPAYEGQTLVVTVTGPSGFKLTPTGSLGMSPENGTPLVYHVHQGNIGDTVGPLCAKITLSALGGGVGGLVFGGPPGLIVGVMHGAVGGLVSGVFDALNNSEHQTVATIVIPNATAQSYLFRVENPWSHPWSSNTVAVNPIMTSDVNTALLDSVVVADADLTFGNGLQSKSFETAEFGERTISLAYVGPSGADLEIVVKGPNSMILEHGYDMQVIDWNQHFTWEQALGDFSMHLVTAVVSNMGAKVFGNQAGLAVNGLLRGHATALGVKLGQHATEYVTHVISRELLRDAIRGDLLEYQDIAESVLTDGLTSDFDKSVAKKLLKKLISDRKDTLDFVAVATADVIDDLWSSASANHDEWVLRIPSAKSGSIYRFRVRDPLRASFRKFHVFAGFASYER